MLPLDKDLREMIALAMREKAPKMYARLRTSGELEATLARRAEEATESYLEAVGIESKADVLRRQMLPPLEQIADRTMQLKVAAAEVIEQATEFSSECEAGEEF